MDEMVSGQVQRRGDVLHHIEIVRVAGTGTLCGEGYCTLGSMKGESRIPHALCPPDVPAPGSSALLCCHTSVLPGITLLPAAVPGCNLSLPRGRAGPHPPPPGTL